jgi:hypothetical protein
MALATYSDLKTAIGDWSFDAGSVLSSFYDDFIDLAESRLNRHLRVREMEADEDLTLVSGVGSLPADYLEWRKVTSVGSPRRQLEFVTPDYLETMYPTRSSGEPCVFTIDGSGITVLPIPSSTVTLFYYQKLTALSDANTSNWLLAKSPQTYLHATCLEAAIFQGNVQRAAEMGSLLDRDLAELRKDDQGARYATGRMRVGGITP